MEACLISKRQANIPMVPVIALSSQLYLGTRIFASTSNIFGREALESARRWETFALRVSSTYAQIEFLHRCLDSRVLPKTLSYKPPVNTRLARQWVMQRGRRMTRVLLQDCHFRLHKYRRILSQSSSKCSELVGKNEIALLSQVIGQRARELRSRRDRELMDKFQKLSSVAQDDNDVLVHNLSSKEFEPEQIQVLKHAAGFNISDADAVNLVATIESVLKHSQETAETQQLIRQQVTSLVMAHKPRLVIPRAQQDALRALKADKSIVILPADKGRSTVILDKAEYLQKANTLLEDRQAYVKCDGDPMKKLVTQINTTLTMLQNNGAMTRTERLATKPTDAAMARFYGLPKIHKDGAPLRPIVSLRGTPTFNLAKWMFRRLNCLTSGSDTTVRSSVHSLERLKGLQIDAGEVMVSFDVTSLFTSIPKDLRSGKYTHGSCDRHIFSYIYI
ncbi:hypothetical protein SprV_0401717200 [Sparganum proliferum]